MHSYGRDFQHTAKIHLALAAISVGAYFALAYALAAVSALSVLKVSPLLTLSLFGALEFAFDRWLWRLLCHVPGMKFIDFSGVYEGRLKAGDGDEFDAKVTITQTWSKIFVAFDSGSAKANSFSASIISDRLRTGQTELVYNYFAHGGRQTDGTRFDHYGTTRLTIDRATQVLAGEYYTEQSRDSFGTLHLLRTGK